MKCWHNLRKQLVSYNAHGPTDPAGLRAFVIAFMKDYSFRLVKNSPEDALLFKRVFETEE